MSLYNWRKNYTATYSNQNQIIRGKLAFKTKSTQWIETETPVIVLVSVHSAFHDEISGDLKMNALMSTIKNYVKGKITILLSDKAHIQTLSLNYQNNVHKAFEICLNSAHTLKQRYQEYFENCNVVYWHSYICQDNNYILAQNLLKELYQTDLIFRDLLVNDAEATYNNDRMKLFSDKMIFIEKTIEDLLEQCACILILVNKGYRFQFYHGSPYASIEYVNRLFFTEDKQICWIDVFLTIEKKTVVWSQACTPNVRY